MLDHLGLIHMGGRVYDPDAGRFLSARGGTAMSALLEFIEARCAEFVEAHNSPDKNRANGQKKKIIGQVCSSLPKSSALERFTWFEDALKDDSKKWFVLEIFKNTKKLPQNLFLPLIGAAMHEKNVSLQGYFIEPCVRTFGEEKVASVLRGYVSHGTDDEASAAKAVLYWVPRFRGE